MKTKIFFVAAIVSMIIVIACNTENKKSAVNDTEMKTKQDTIERGRYLVSVMACHDCHSPKAGPGLVLDSTRLLSGFSGKEAPVTAGSKEAVKEGWVLFGPDFTSALGPWGKSFAANLTSDETGIGNWSEEQFFTAIRKGKYKGMMNNRGLLPPMPWELIRKATDEDLRAIFTYLKSIKPVRNVVPAPVAFNDL